MIRRNGPTFPLSTLPARPLARRAGNPRGSAFSGFSPKPGLRAATGDGINPFIGQHVPELWLALTGEFGRPATYWLDGDQSQAVDITVVWKEGAEDEEVSPGRYSRAIISNADLPRQPKLGDKILRDGVEYGVSRVDAYPYNLCTVVLEDLTENF